MKLSRLIFWITMLAIFSMAAQVAIDTDSWWHLRAGQWMVENRSLMEVDLFSYTRGGAPWQYPGLWVEALMYVLFEWFGPGGVNLWAAGTITLTFWIVWQTTSGGTMLKAFVVVLAAVTSGIYWAARPYLMTFLLAAVFYWLLEAYREKKSRHLWWLPVLMVLWVNSHGAYLVGFLVWAPYLAGEGWAWLAAKRSGEENEEAARRLRHYLVVGGLMAAAMLLNPQGVELLALPFTTVGRGAEQQFIAEWQSPNFHLINQQPFAWLLILSIGVLGASGKKVSLTEFLLLGGFGFLGLLAVRFVSIFAVIAPAILTRHAAGLLPDWIEKLGISIEVDFERPPTPLQGRLNRLLVVVFFGVAAIKAVSVFPPSANMAVFEENLPVAAVEYVKEVQPEGRMFNSYNFGGYLVWALPEYPVFIDGRADLYGDEIINEWLRTYSGADGWQDRLDDWDVGFVLVEPNAPLAKLLAYEGWELVYTDEVAVVYQR